MTDSIVRLESGGLDGVVLAGVGKQLEPVAVPPNRLSIAPGAAVVEGVTVSDEGARLVDERGRVLYGWRRVRRRRGLGEDRQER